MIQKDLTIEEMLYKTDDFETINNTQILKDLLDLKLIIIVIIIFVLVPPIGMMFLLILFVTILRDDPLIMIKIIRKIIK